MRVHLAQNLRTDEVIYSNKFSGESQTNDWIAQQATPADWMHFTVDFIDIHWKSVKGMIDYVSNHTKLAAAEQYTEPKQRALKQETAAVDDAHQKLVLAQADLERAAQAHSAESMVAELTSIATRRARYTEILHTLEQQYEATETPPGSLTSSIRNTKDALQGLNSREDFLKLQLAALVPAATPAPAPTPAAGTAASRLAAAKAVATPGAGTVQKPTA